jgi:hypothetical protein
MFIRLDRDRAQLELILLSCKRLLFYYNNSFYSARCFIDRITSGKHKSDNNNRIIQLTNVFRALFMHKRASNLLLH